MRQAFWDITHSQGLPDTITDTRTDETYDLPRMVTSWKERHLIEIAADVEAALTALWRERRTQRMTVQVESAEETTSAERKRQE